MAQAVGAHAGAVAIIGAGWAGLACAMEMCAAGLAVTLYESNTIPGGRARRVVLPSGLTCDNGQHLLLGAYSETMRQIGRVHAQPSAYFQRLPLTLASTRSYDHVADVALVRKPIPVVGTLAGLLGAKGLTLGEKMSLVGYIARAVINTDIDLTRTVAEDIASVAPAVRDRLLSPLCLAALNTPAERASAKVFRNVLRASFTAGASGSDMLIPNHDLSATFPDAAVKWLIERGATVMLGETVMILNEAQQSGATAVEIVSRHHAHTFSHVVLAVAPQHIPRLLSPLPAWQPLARALEGLAFEPITTLYQTEFALREALPHPPLLSVDDPVMQWVFHHKERRLRAVVVSGADAHGERTLEDLRGYAAQRTGSLPSAWQGITEKRATYSCTPQQHVRLSTLPKPTGPIWLAGDYCYPDFPATLESATRSGRATADAIIKTMTQQQ
jgi:hydroxysqualene dehydroxylase